MKPERREGRWAKIQRWAKEHEEWERGSSERRASAEREQERQQAESRQREEEKKQREQALGLTMAGGLLVIMSAIVVVAVTDRPYVSVGLGGGPILWFLAVIPALGVVPLLQVMARVVLGRPRDINEKFSTGCFAVVIGFLPSWLLCVQVALWANAALGTGPIRVVQTTVASKYAGSSKGTPYYHLLLREWNPRREGNAPSLSVSRERYDSTPEGAPVTVYTKPGLLGIEWIMDYSVR